MDRRGELWTGEANYGQVRQILNRIQSREE